MILKTINANSDGNCHLLIDDEGKILLLDVGVTIKDIKKAVDFRVTDIVGAVVTHSHKDHSKAMQDLKNMGKQVFAPYTRKDKAERVSTCCWKYKIDAFALTDKDKEHFVHTDQTGEECVCYGFYIRHDDYPGWNLIYITDCMYCKWSFTDVENIMIGTNFSVDMLNVDKPTKTIHQVTGHMSIDTVCQYVAKMQPRSNVILTHLSLDTADADEFKKQVSKVVDCSVHIAKRGKNIQI